MMLFHNITIHTVLSKNNSKNLNRENMEFFGFLAKASLDNAFYYYIWHWILFIINHFFCC